MTRRINGYGNVNYDCDSCGTALDSGHKRLKPATVAMKAADWWPVWTATGWHHACPSCQSNITRASLRNYEPRAPEFRGTGNAPHPRT